MGRPRTVSDEEKKKKRAERMRKRWLSLSPEQKAEHYKRKNEARNKKYAEKSAANGRRVRKWRFTSEERRESDKAKYACYRAKNLEKIRLRDARIKREERATEEGLKKSHESQKRYRERNRDKIAVACRLWREGNLERDIKRKRSYYKSHKEEHFAWNRTRRARVRGAGGKHTAKDIAELLRRQKWKCAWCLLALGEDKYHVDHYVPLVLGGSNDVGNLRILHARCNLRKHKKHPADFAQQNGLLCW